MGIIQVQGALTAGPLNGTVPSAGNGGVLNVALALKGGVGSKPYAIASGLMQYQLQTADATTYQTLPGIGSAPGVLKGDTIYFFATAPILLRLTFDNGGVDIVSVIPVDGLFLLEVNANKWLKLVEAAGTAGIEYLVTSPSQ